VLAATMALPAPLPEGGRNMTDPTRWCDDPGDLSPAERRVLLADARFGPPHHAKSAVWAGMATGLGVGVAGNASATAASAISESVAASGTAAAAGPAGLGLSLGTVVKLVLVGVGIGTSVAGVGHYMVTRDTPRVSLPSRSTTASTVAPHARPQVAPLSDRQQPTPESSLKRTNAESTAEEVLLPPTAADRRREPSEPEVLDNGAVDRLAPNARSNLEAAPVVVPVSPDAWEESQVIGKARSALRSNDAALALQLLELAERRYPQGVLNQEREALCIEALAGLGRTAEARARAKAFLRAYPTSPYASRVKSRTGEP
jgi:hypothetical protein